LHGVGSSVFTRPVFRSTWGRVARNRRSFFADGVYSPRHPPRQAREKIGAPRTGAPRSPFNPDRLFGCAQASRPARLFRGWHGPGYLFPPSKIAGNCPDRRRPRKRRRSPTFRGLVGYSAIVNAERIRTTTRKHPFAATVGLSQRKVPICAGQG